MVSGDRAQTEKPQLVGYVYCASDKAEHSVPVFIDHVGFPVGNLSCGQKLDVVAQAGLWLKVVTPDGITRFIKSAAVSQKPDDFVPVAAPTEADPAMNHPPLVVLKFEPDYLASTARLAKKEGTVLLGLVVGVDGLPRDVKIVSSLDKDLDAKCIQAVQQWRFQPALKDGQPVEAPIKVRIEFRRSH